MEKEKYNQNRIYASTEFTFICNLPQFIISDEDVALAFQHYIVAKLYLCTEKLGSNKHRVAPIPPYRLTETQFVPAKFSVDSMSAEHVISSILSNHMLVPNIVDNKLYLTMLYGVWYEENLTKKDIKRFPYKYVHTWKKLAHRHDYAGYLTALFKELGVVVPCSEKIPGSCVLADGVTFTSTTELQFELWNTHIHIADLNAGAQFVHLVPPQPQFDEYNEGTAL